MLRTLRSWGVTHDSANIRGNSHGLEHRQCFHVYEYVIACGRMAVSEIHMPVIPISTASLVLTQEAAGLRTFKLSHL